MIIKKVLTWHSSLDFPKLGCPFLDHTRLSQPTRLLCLDHRRLDEIIRKTTQNKKKARLVYMFNKPGKRKLKSVPVLQFHLKGKEPWMPRQSPLEPQSTGTREATGMEENQPPPQKIVFVLILRDPSQPFRKRAIMCNVITANVGPGKFTLESDYHWLFTK